MRTAQFAILIPLLIVSHFTNGQNIGIRSGVEFADKEQVSHTIGGGVFLTFKSFSEKIHVITAFDYFGKNNQFGEKDLSTSYSKYRFSSGVLFATPLSERVSFKIGPSMSYNFLNATHQGIILRWIANYNAQAVGIETIGEIEIRNIFQSPFCLNISLIPSYLINISHNIDTPTDVTGTRPQYGGNFLILNIQAGIAYKF